MRPNRAIANSSLAFIDVMSCGLGAVIMLLVLVDFDFIITVCDHAKENCPFIASPNAVRLHHNFYDPSKFIGTEQEIHAAFLKARTEIKEFMKAFVNQNF